MPPSAQHIRNASWKEERERVQDFAFAPKSDGDIHSRRNLGDCVQSTSLVVLGHCFVLFPPQVPEPHVESIFFPFWDVDLGSILHRFISIRRARGQVAYGNILPDIEQPQMHMDSWWCNAAEEYGSQGVVALAVSHWGDACEPREQLPETINVRRAYQGTPPSDQAISSQEHRERETASYSASPLT